MSGHVDVDAAPSHARQPASWLAGTDAAIDLREKRYPPTKIAVLLEVLSEMGVPTASVLVQAGLDAQALGDAATLTSSLQFLAAAREAVRLYDGNDLGLLVGCRVHASCYGMYGYAMLCAESMERAFDTAVRYHRLSNGMMDIEWVQEGGTASWLFPGRDELPLPAVDDRLYRFLIDLQFGIHATVVKDVMGTWCVPARAQFREAEPPHAAALSAALECPIEFDQPRNALSYPAAWLSRAPQMANPITAAQVSGQCAKLVEQFRWQAGVTRRVYQELTRTPGRFPEIEVIAESLCMTSRTLRRRLEAEGTSYSDLLVSVRKALAIDYLSTTLLGIEDVAATVGFSDVVAFRHAFKRWTGKTPGEYRRDRSAAALRVAQPE
ncbi:MAG: AraC family transcriptional regulator [Proteobacteria bacterium]|nr:AraC family transcriptional regulator [Pseudomonadota bacterium]